MSQSTADTAGWGVLPFPESDWGLICALKEAAGRWEYSYHTKQQSEPKNQSDMSAAKTAILDRFKQLHKQIADLTLANERLRRTLFDAQQDAKNALNRVDFDGQTVFGTYYTDEK